MWWNQVIKKNNLGFPIRFSIYKGKTEVGLYCIRYIIRSRSASSGSIVLEELDEEQVDSAVRADWAVRMFQKLHFLIYGCTKCRVRSLHRKDEIPWDSKIKSLSDWLPGLTAEDTVSVVADTQ